MGTASKSAWAAGLLVLAVPGLAACAEDHADDPGGRLERAVVAQASFALMADEGRLTVAKDDETIAVAETRLDTNQPDPSVTAISSEAVALVADDLMVVREDGSLERTECEGCGDVVWTGRDLAVVQESVTEGGTFEIDYFGTDLERQSTTVARRITERAAPGAEPESDSGGVELLAANESTVWVSYTDRFGFARGGSRTIAAYSRGGDLLGSTQVEGTIYRHSVSPDGRFLAVADGGSGGACITVAEIDVIDLTTMRTLDTTPRMPVAAEVQADPVDLPALNFSAQALSWQGRLLTAAGSASRGNAPEEAGGCDPKATAWRRTYDTREQRFTDHQQPGVVELGVGPRCGDTLRWDLPNEQWELRTQSGTPIGSPDWSLLYVPSAPSDC